MPALAGNESSQEPRAIQKDTTSSVAGFGCQWSPNNCASEAVLRTQLQGCINSDKPPQGQWNFPMPCGGNSTSHFLVQAHVLYFASVGQDQSFLISQQYAVSGSGPAVAGMALGL